jgi:3-hydroxyacyl-[acyl-carrier-protein] dehydratase
MNTGEKILRALPYGKNFCFVDEIEQIDENSITGRYTFTKELFFYDAHFREKPLIPGVILIETMGQIGMVCHLIYLMNDYNFHFLPVLSNVEVIFMGHAKYNEPLCVTGRKIYFRKNILRSSVEMLRANGDVIAALTANIMIVKKDE